MHLSVSPWRQSYAFDRRKGESRAARGYSQARAKGPSLPASKRRRKSFEVSKKCASLPARRENTWIGNGTQPDCQRAGFGPGDRDPDLPHGRGGGAGRPLRLQLLGPFAIRQGGRAVRALPKKTQALLAYLAMQNGRAVPREQLAELLWGSSGGQQARRSLRQSLMGIRAALKTTNGDALLADGDNIGMAAGHDVATDVAEFEQRAAALNAEDLDAAQTLYRAEFLSGLQIASEAFAEWLLIERRKLASTMSDVLYRLASAREQAGEVLAAIAAAERLTAFDPLREDGHRLLMRLLAAGRTPRCGAEELKRCADLLRRELGVAPEPVTAALAEAIRSGGALQPRSPGPRPAGGARADATRQAVDCAASIRAILVAARIRTILRTASPMT